MNEIERAPTREDIERLQNAMSKLPQIELKTLHYFADGVYVREMHCPAGSTIVGKVHKREHFFLLLSGEMTVTGDGHAPRRLKAPVVIVSKPGVKRAGYAHTECVCANIHRTDNRDLDAIEMELIECDPSALFDARNEVIPPKLEVTP